MDHGPQRGLAGLVGPPAGAEGAAEPPLVPAERALGLPPLAVHPPVPAALRPRPEPPDHLVAVLPPDRAGPAAPAEHREHGRADAQAVAGVGVEVLPVERPVPQQGVDGPAPGGRPDGLPELAGVAPRAAGGDGRQEQVGAAVGDRRQLRPAGQARGPAGPEVEVAADVAALQPGRVDRRPGPVGDQPAAGRDGRREEGVYPFFSGSRSAAFWSVEWSGTWSPRPMAARRSDQSLRCCSTPR